MILKTIDHTNKNQYTTSTKIEKFVGNHIKNIFLGLENSSERNISILYSPCISKNSRIWCVIYHRYATLNELFCLQGFEKNFIKVVSSTQIRYQIGNSMSVNVIKKIIQNL